MLRTAVLRALAVGLTLMLLAVGAPTLHEHRATEPALYDDECPLSQLGAGGTEGGLPQIADLIAPLPPATIPPAPTPRGRSEAPRLPSGPRGPPIAG